jgi:hypothetical protein
MAELGMPTEGVVQAQEHIEALRANLLETGGRAQRPRLVAHRWLAEGGMEGDLMRIAGWRNRRCSTATGRSVAAQRAFDAHGHLSPSDRL